MADRQLIGDALEWFFEKTSHVQHLSEGCLYRWAVHPHKGRSMVFSDGTMVRRGDPVIELHLDNQQTRRIYEEAGGSDRAFALAYLHAGRSGMHEAAELVDRDLPQVVAVFANTPRRFAGIAERFGYETRELDSSLRSRAIGRIQAGALRRFDPEGFAKIAAGSPELVPVEIWMSRATLLRRHLSPGGLGNGGAVR